MLHRWSWVAHIQTAAIACRMSPFLVLLNQDHKVYSMNIRVFGPIG
jgi:hypothetical protein